MTEAMSRAGCSNCRNGWSFAKINAKINAKILICFASIGSAVASLCI